MNYLITLFSISIGRRETLFKAAVRLWFWEGVLANVVPKRRRLLVFAWAWVLWLGLKVSESFCISLGTNKSLFSAKSSGCCLYLSYECLLLKIVFVWSWSILILSWNAIISCRSLPKLLFNCNLSCILELWLWLNFFNSKRLVLVVCSRPRIFINFEH